MHEFHMPSFDMLDEEGNNICPKGWHNFTATAFEATYSANTRPMIKVQWTCDSGGAAGHKVEELYVLGMNGWPWESRLKKLHVINDKVFEPAGTLEDFVAQLIPNTFRARLKIDHEWVIETAPRIWDNVSEKRFNEHDGKKFAKATCGGMKGGMEKPDGPAEIDFLKNDAWAKANDGMGLDEETAFEEDPY